jgi:hypothetical protein
MESIIRRTLPFDARWTKRVDALLARIKYCVEHGWWDEEIMDHIRPQRSGGSLFHKFPPFDLAAQSKASSRNYQSFANLRQLRVPKYAAKPIFPELDKEVSNRLLARRRLRQKVFHVGPVSAAVVPDDASEMLGELEPESPEDIFDAAAEWTAEIALVEIDLDVVTRAADEQIHEQDGDPRTAVRAADD